MAPRATTPGHLPKLPWTLGPHAPLRPAASRVDPRQEASSHTRRRSPRGRLGRHGSLQGSPVPLLQDLPVALDPGPLWSREQVGPAARRPWARAWLGDGPEPTHAVPVRPAALPGPRRKRAETRPSRRRLGPAPARHGPGGPSRLSPGSPAVLHTHAQRGGHRRWTWRGRTALILTTGDNATASVNDGRRAARGSAHALFTQVTLTVPCAFAVTVSVTSIKHGCAIHPTVHTPSHQNQAQHTPVTVTLKPQRPHPSRPPSCRTAARTALDQPRVSTP